jgi:hypothetical protein
MARPQTLGDCGMVDRKENQIRNTAAAAALWRRLDDPGHDAARLEPQAGGWLLRGVAVFNHHGAPACIAYALELDSGWATRTAHVQGFVGQREVRHAITRSNGRWLHNGARVAGLDHLLDIDFGFTPATNLQQLRRVPLAVGQQVDLPVAWLNVDSTGLSELPQTYRRLSKTSYAYDAPSVSYHATLKIAANGFAQAYPTGWKLVAWS